jgi:predicted ATP-binding protein involved in virulence
MLWAAYPGRDPSRAEGVVAIDEIELHQEAIVQQQVVGMLRRVLPGVQWIITTASPVVAASCDQNEVLALRRLPNEPRVELYEGPEARVH